MSDFKFVDIYVYDPITKEFLYKSISDKNPLEPENPIIPSCATTVVPLDKKDGYATVWVGNKWEYKEDHRGEIWYNSNTKNNEEISFIGILPEKYYSLDSKIANKPEGDYWVYNKEIDLWEGDPFLYKKYISKMLKTYWDIKQNTPFELNGFKYIPSWKDLYISIWTALKDGIKEQYRLKDFDGKFNYVNLETMKPIVQKIIDINDEMFIDKHNIEINLDKINDFETLEKKFNEYINKIYK